MELNKENMKKIRWLIAFSVLLYLGVQNLDVVLKYVKIVGTSSAICVRWSYGVCAGMYLWHLLSGMFLEKQRKKKTGGDVQQQNLQDR